MSFQPDHIIILPNVPESFALLLSISLPLSHSRQFIEPSVIIGCLFRRWFRIQSPEWVGTCISALSFPTSLPQLKSHTIALAACWKRKKSCGCRGIDEAFDTKCGLIRCRPQMRCPTKKRNQHCSKVYTALHLSGAHLFISIRVVADGATAEHFCRKRDYRNFACMHMDFVWWIVRRLRERAEEPNNEKC